MAQLTDAQANTIYDLLLDSGVSLDSLRVDLLDHLCCMVEQKMDNGLDFGQSLSLSIQEFGLSNLAEIQEATIHLLTLKLNKMKKAIGFVGIFSAMAVISGVIFKVNHWLGASVLLVIGLVCTSLIVFPCMAFLKAKKGKTTMQIIAVISGYLAAILLSIATLFKIMHWPGFFQLYYPGLFLLVFVFMPLYTVKSYRTAENKIMAFSRSLLILAGVAVAWGLMPMMMNARGGQQAPIREFQPNAVQEQVQSETHVSLLDNEKPVNVAIHLPAEH